MSYGDSDYVNSLTDSYYEAAKITAAITLADTIVDLINSNANSDNKKIASSLIAAEILRKGGATKLLDGTSNKSANNEPARSIAEKYSDIIPSLAMDLLRSSISFSFGYEEPTSSGKWT